ncbi:MAG: hypothetical protein J6A85_04940 [Clostridia bacterium]|nr:hypothetical protein [Clostridia bacterium]
MFRQVISKIKDNGYEAYLVGGSVRDMILGRDIYDYDICTSAYPEKIKDIFSDYPVIETGIKHGTVTLVYQKIPFEITVFRSEQGYKDHRHPDKVIFGASLEEDLSRRDFTMNAICFDGEEFIDPLKGKEDIESRLIRAVGEPERRFSEDALRILRGLRFACVLGFEIEPKTAAAMRAYAEDLSVISVERIFAELKKAAAGKYFGQVYNQYYDIFARFIPNAVNEKQIFKSKDDAVDALRKLKADKKSIYLAEAYFSAPEDGDIITLLRSYGEECTRFICEKRGLTEALEAVLAEKKPYKVSMLDISGKDILPLTEDKSHIGSILEALLDDVIAGKTENKREILLEKVVDIL